MTWVFLIRGTQIRFKLNKKSINTQINRPPFEPCGVHSNTARQIMLYFSRWSSQLMSSQLWNLCPFVAHFGYLLTCGGIFSLASQSADTLQASVGMVRLRLPDRFRLMAGLLPAIETPRLYFRRLLAPASPIKAAQEKLSLHPKPLLDPSTDDSPATGHVVPIVEIANLLRRQLEKLDFVTFVRCAFDHCHRATSF